MMMRLPSGRYVLDLRLDLFPRVILDRRDVDSSCQKGRVAEDRLIPNRRHVLVAIICLVAGGRDEEPSL